MFQKMHEVKVLRDPIHGYIHVDLQIVWDCINAREMQRLRRIRQLGGAFQVYHAAEHSRFSHSLGVYEIVRRMVNEIKGLPEQLSEREKVAVMLAGLLHDIGHGPYSHAFESVCKVSHETFTRRILTEDSEVSAILAKADPSLPQEVASIIDHTHPNKLLSQMISGQVDADRMDYLLRDAYFTGTKYGEFDLERMLRTIRVKDHRLVVKESGIHTVEDYIMARYHMYWQVYYHPAARSFEIMLALFFKRLQALDARYFDEPGLLFLKPFIQPNGKISIQDHFRLDETTCNAAMAFLQQKEIDPIASDLGMRLLNRHLFEYEDILDDRQVLIRARELEEAGFDPAYYLGQDEVRQRPYLPYGQDEQSMIFIVREEGEIVELSRASVIVDALVGGRSKNDLKMYYPKEFSKRRLR